VPSEASAPKPVSQKMMRRCRVIASWVLIWRVCMSTTERANSFCPSRSSPSIARFMEKKRVRDSAALPARSSRITSSPLAV
jgi:hypothetical protein